MKVSIDKFSKVPVYLQIADQIKSQIISGALPRGSALPSERRSWMCTATPWSRPTASSRATRGSSRARAWATSWPRQTTKMTRRTKGAARARSPAVSTGSARWRKSTSTWKRHLTTCSSALRTRATIPSAAASPRARCTRPSALRAISRRCSRAAARASIFSAPIRAINSCGRSSWPFSARRA